jgi:hypothetical protein
MIRSALALVAAGWFAYNAAFFLPAPFAYLNEGQLGGIDGDPGAVAVTWAARTLFAGLAVLALAVVDWEWVSRALRSSGTLPSPSDIPELR